MPTNLWRKVSIRDVASLLEVHPMTVYRWAQSGTIPAIKLGGRWRFRADVCSSWLDTELHRQTTARLAWHPKTRTTALLPK